MRESFVSFTCLHTRRLGQFTINPKQCSKALLAVDQNANRCQNTENVAAWVSVIDGQQCVTLVLHARAELGRSDVTDRVQAQRLPKLARRQWAAIDREVHA